MASIAEAAGQVASEIRIAGDVDVDDMEEALHKAGEIMLEDMDPRIPVETGQLRESMEKETIQKRAGEGVTVAVGPNRDGWYAHFIETGTDRGVAPQPFMRPAFDTRVNDMLLKITLMLNSPLT